jgi:two-component system cell cycle sensor histidine kinase/response regulator CckA
VEHLLGFKIADLIGQHYTTIVFEEDRDKARWFFDERRTSPRAGSGIELRLKVNGSNSCTKNAFRHLTVELKSMGLYEASGKNNERCHIGTHGVIRDISERQKIQAKLQNAERLESLGTLAGGIAHDFNNLLMGIQGRSSLISMEMELSQNLQEHLDAIDEYIRSAAHLTKQLLGFARGGKYEVKPTDINALIGSSADMFGRTKKEVIIETDFHDPAPVVSVDRRQIEQVLLNLFVNAWQAMPEGGTLQIETNEVVMDKNTCGLHQLPPGRYAKTSVTDTGIGIDPKTLHHIFDPFFTTKEKNRGTGLGLASAYGIIKNHGGIIHATSEVGIGSTFNIYLPLTDHKATKIISIAPKVSSGTETILLVDDEAMILDVGKALLQKLGYSVMVADSGESAMDTVRHLGAEIDLVILDMIMPGIDGGKTFDGIRSLIPTMPVVLSSGYAINRQAEEIMRRGCNGFIQKPFTIADLSQKIRKILEAAAKADMDDQCRWEALPN